MKLLLHACCGPCSLEPTRLLKAAGHDITIYYANSNIHPAEEYQHRLATLRAWASAEGFDVLEGPYNPASWENVCGRIGDAAIADVERARARGSRKQPVAIGYRHTGGRRWRKRARGFGIRIRCSEWAFTGECTHRSRRERV